MILLWQGNTIPSSLVQQLILEGREKNIKVNFGRDVLDTSVLVKRNTQTPQQNIDSGLSYSSCTASDDNSDAEERWNYANEKNANDSEVEECAHEGEIPESHIDLAQTVADVQKQVADLGMSRNIVAKVGRVMRNHHERDGKADFRNIKIISMPFYRILFEIMLRNESYWRLDLKVVCDA